MRLVASCQSMRAHTPQTASALVGNTAWALSFWESDWVMLNISGSSQCSENGVDQLLVWCLVMNLILSFVHWCAITPSLLSVWGIGMHKSHCKGW